ncbi:SH3 domain-containing protein [Priestia megaterium]
MDDGVGITLFWLAIAPYIRIAIITFLFMLVFRHINLFILNKGGTLFISLSSLLIRFILLFVIQPALVVVYKIIGSKLGPGFFKKVESLIDFIKNLLIALPDKWKNLFSKKQLVQSRYKKITFILPLLLGCIAFQWKEVPLVTAWYTAEERFMKEDLGVANIDSEDARERVMAWVGIFGDERIVLAKGETKFVLKDDFQGGTVRSEPRKTSLQIHIISPNEPVTYLGDKAEDSNNVVWYKVQTNTNQEGWISSRIITIQHD